MINNIGDIGRFVLACIGALVIGGGLFLMHSGEGKPDYGISILIWVLYNNLLILDSRKKNGLA